MTKTSVLNDALNAINNAEKTGKRQVMIRPSSKVIVKFLTVMQKHGKSTRGISISHISSAQEEDSSHTYAHTPGLITRQWSHISPRPTPFKFSED